MGYLERIDSYKDEMLESLAELIAKPSVKADAARSSGSILTMMRTTRPT